MTTTTIPASGFDTMHRRTFLQAAGAAGAAGLFLTVNPDARAFERGQFASDLPETDANVTNMYTVCQQCHARCGLKVRATDGVLTSIQGNPWHPCNAEDHTTVTDYTASYKFGAATVTPKARLEYSEDPWGNVAAAGHPNFGQPVKHQAGSVCGKAAAMIQCMYSPYRIKHPLQRVGNRGSGQWKTVSWATALNAIGTFLGARRNTVDALTANDVDPADPTGRGAAIVAAAATPADDLGRRANKVATAPGRAPHGQKEFYDWFWAKAFGTVNKRLDHTSICETSHHVAMDLCGWTAGKAPDIMRTNYLILWGMTPLEAGFPHQAYARKLMYHKFDSSNASSRKLVVIDPRYSNTAAKADVWVPVKPGYDAALAWGMIRHVFDNFATLITAGRSGNGESFLRTVRANDRTTFGETSGCDAAYLVVTDATTGQYRSLKSSELGIAGADKYCVIGSDNKVYTIDDVGTTAEVTALTKAVSKDTIQLFANGVTAAAASGDASTLSVTTVLQVVRTYAETKTVAAWAALAGVAEGAVKQIAADFMAAAPAACADFYRGPVQHPNGCYTALALFYLNVLAGNLDRVGGLTKGGSHWHEDGSKSTASNDSYDYAGGGATTSAPTIKGYRIDRAAMNNVTPASAPGGKTMKHYGNTPWSSVDGYPARRPWFPLAANGTYQEILPAIADNYPYRTDFLLTMWNAIVYSTPAARTKGTAALTALAPDQTNAEIADFQTDKDGKYYRLGMHVCVDVEMGEMAALADYVLPDTNFLEKWSTPHNAGLIQPELSGMRHPVSGEVWTATGYKSVASYFTDLTGVKQLVTDLDAALAADAGGHNFFQTPATTTPYFRPFLPDTRAVEDIFFSLAKYINDRMTAGARGGDAATALPNVGAATGASDGIKNRGGTLMPLRSAWDWARVMFTNLVTDSGAPSFGGETTVDGKIAYALARGGLFDSPSEFQTAAAAAPAGFQHAQKKGVVRFFSELLTQTPDSMKSATGALVYFQGLGVYEEPAGMKGTKIAARYAASYPFTLITHKSSWHGQGRTTVAPALVDILPENPIELNATDAAGLGIVTGDRVRVSNPNGEFLEGVAKVSGAMRPGVVAISHHFGHWELSSRPWTLDGTAQGHDPSRGLGVTPNPVMLIDPDDSTQQVCLQDLVGGSSSFYDSPVTLEKVS